MKVLKEFLSQLTFGHDWWNIPICNLASQLFNSGLLLADAIDTNNRSYLEYQE